MTVVTPNTPKPAPHDSTRPARLTHVPAPKAAPWPRMLLAQTLLETRLLLRNGEQVLLTLVIPVGALVLLAKVPVLRLGGGSRVDFLVPGAIALAVLATSFTSLAIATGFERRYGVLKRLGASPLPRWCLLGGKALTVLVVQLVQTALICATGWALGWSARGGVLPVLALLALATLALAALGLLMAGTLRAEVNLAAANLVFLVLLVGGGVLVPLDAFPAGAHTVLSYTPVAALSDGLRLVLAGTVALPVRELAVLAGWAVAGVAAAVRAFRWE